MKLINVKRQLINPSSIKKHITIIGKSRARLHVSDDKVRRIYLPYFASTWYG